MQCSCYFLRSRASVFITLVIMLYACKKSNEIVPQIQDFGLSAASLSRIGDTTGLSSISKNIKWSSQALQFENIPNVNLENRSILDLITKSPFILNKADKVEPDKIQFKNIANTPIAAMPESVPAKEMAEKAQNLSSIGYFDKRQGLKQSFVASLLNDKFGNIWFGTHGGGLTRFDGKYFTHFTEKEGLANNSVFCIKHFSDNKIWIGTYGKGISVFDGNNFQNISSANGLPSDNIYSIIEDKRGRIWIGTQGGGLVMLDHKNPKAFFHYNTKNGFFSDNITSILEDKNGNIWIGSEDNGIAKFEENNLAIPLEKKFSSLTITDMTLDTLGSIWVSTYGQGLFKIDGQSMISFNENSKFPSNLLTSVKIDNSGNIWVSSDGKGVVKMTLMPSGSYEVSLIDSAQGLSSDNVYSIVEDNSGSMWFGTNRGGVNKYNGNKFLQIYGENVFCITEDKHQSIWIGTNEKGIIKLDGDKSKSISDKVSSLTTSNGLTSNKVFCSYTDKKNRKWFGTSNGITLIEEDKILSLDGENALCGKKILTVFEDKKGLLWFGLGENEGIAIYDGKNITCLKKLGDKNQSAVFTIAEDKDGRMWFGTEGDGIIILDKGIFYKFNEEMPFNKNAVFSFKFDSDGLMWVATEGNGVFVYDGKKFYNINEQMGLSNNFVFSILEDNNTDLWFGTRFGLSILPYNNKNKLLLDLKNNSIQTNIKPYFNTYSYGDGFFGLGCNRNAIFQSSDQSVWIGTTDRLTLSHLVKTKNIDKKEMEPMSFFISKIDLFNENIKWVDLNKEEVKSQKLQNRKSIQNIEFTGLTPWYNAPKDLCLDHDNNYLTFYFTSITQDQPWNVKYQYKIKEMDTGWSTWQTDNTAHYSHLHPGTYTLMARAMDRHGNQSQTLSYKFKLRDPWWFSWWMKVVYLLGIIGGLYSIHINQKNKTIKNERLKTQAKELEHAREIEKAFSELKATQAQLIQSEKMASLGELTAGIAHEIQNPLNFVNNFSELNLELLSELTEELEKDNLDDVKTIVEDIKVNESKIHSHGKRADSIVKGMLMHSRANTGKKEPTDLNILCSEYLSLVYHGFRAKDKTFNTTIEKDFDNDLPILDLVPQEIGRVILNITNNALHAVKEKSLGLPHQYNPKIKVTTSKDKNNVVIKIEDNGNGIPETIKNKIFQPFFTTKPTGQGTGLGLSMAYDIIKSHGGILEVESKEGEGSVFKISLPILSKDSR